MDQFDQAPAPASVDLSPTELCDTNFFTDTANHVYSCPNWHDYQLLLIEYRFYGNVMETLLVPTDYFNITNSGQRILMRNQQLVIYVNDRQSINVQYTETGVQYRKITILGLLKR